MVAFAGQSNVFAHVASHRRVVIGVLEHEADRAISNTLGVPADSEAACHHHEDDPEAEGQQVGRRAGREGE